MLDFLKRIAEEVRLVLIAVCMVVGIFTIFDWASAKMFGFKTTEQKKDEVIVQCRDLLERSVDAYSELEAHYAHLQSKCAPADDDDDLDSEDDGGYCSLPMQMCPAIGDEGPCIFDRDDEHCIDPDGKPYEDVFDDEEEDDNECTGSHCNAA